MRARLSEVVTSYEEPYVVDGALIWLNSHVSKQGTKPVDLGPDRERVRVFTEKDKQIAALLLDGYTPGMMPGVLKLKRQTIVNRLQRLYRKFGIHVNSAHNYVRLAILIHEQRRILGVHCPACD